MGGVAIVHKILTEAMSYVKSEGETEKRACVGVSSLYYFFLKYSHISKCVMSVSTELWILVLSSYL